MTVGDGSDEPESSPASGAEKLLLAGAEGAESIVVLLDGSDDPELSPASGVEMLSFAGADGAESVVVLLDGSADELVPVGSVGAEFPIVELSDGEFGVSELALHVPLPGSGPVPT